MAIDEKVAEAVRGALAHAGPVREVKMFGGLGFMLGGNLLCCTSERGLLVRVGEDGKAGAVERGATPMVMNGREMKGFVWVKGTLDARAVRGWLREAQSFVETLPAKGGDKPAAGRQARSRASKRPGPHGMEGPARRAKTAGGKAPRAKGKAPHVRVGKGLS